MITNGLARCLKEEEGGGKKRNGYDFGGGRGGGEEVAYVRPKLGNFFLSASTNLTRIWC